jgi:5'-phosphate synthase pdxT subunit
MDHDDPSASTTRIGVLAMQGAFAEHVRALEACGASAREVRTSEQLDSCDGIVIPGGESTAIRKALDRAELLEPLRAHVAAGLPAFGTCAGMIVLADSVPDGAPACLGLLDIEVERNGFGSQVHSFETSVRLVDDGTSMRGVFIRAPRILHVGDAVTVVARIDGGPNDDEPVAVRQGHLLAASFHPELTDDRSLHRRFIELVEGTRRTPGR